MKALFLVLRLGYKSAGRRVLEVNCVYLCIFSMRVCSVYIIIQDFSLLLIDIKLWDPLQYDNYLEFFSL